jgi:hypothetical protein
MPVDHEFGGQHTELKLSIIEKYLQAYSSALRNKFSELWYIGATVILRFAALAVTRIGTAVACLFRSWASRRPQKSPTMHG